MYSNSPAVFKEFNNFKELSNDCAIAIEVECCGIRHLNAGELCNQCRKMQCCKIVRFSGLIPVSSLIEVLGPKNRFVSANLTNQDYFVPTLLFFMTVAICTTVVTIWILVWLPHDHSADKDSYPHDINFIILRFKLSLTIDTCFINWSHFILWYLFDFATNILYAVLIFFLFLHCQRIQLLSIYMNIAVRKSAFSSFNW